MFGDTLAKIRKELGFPSAYKFFKSVGGSKTLGMAFVSYWDIERGKKLPKSWRLKTIMAALSIDMYSQKAKELVGAYFQSLSGSEELLKVLTAGPARPADLTSRELAESAVQRSVNQRNVQLTSEQWRLRNRDRVMLICSNYIINTAGWVTIQELAVVSGFVPAEIKKALRALAAGGLIEFSGDKARSHLTGKVIQFPPRTAENRDIYASSIRLWNDWIKDCDCVASKRMTMRMSKTDMSIYRQHLTRAVDTATLYENPDADKQGSAVYFVEAVVYKVLPNKEEQLLPGGKM